MAKFSLQEDITHNNRNGSISKPAKIKLLNDFWQRVDWSQGSFHLWKAFYDDRPTIHGKFVRVLTMTKRKYPPQIFCYLWFSNEHVTVDGDVLYGWRTEWGTQLDHSWQFALISCPVPEHRLDPIPDSVSLQATSKNDNNLTNIMKVEKNKSESKEKFVVCMKGMDFLHEDMSTRLIEWIELVKILGSNHVFLYELEIHPNMRTVVNHYVKNGFVTLTKLSLPGDQPNEPNQRHRYLKSHVENQMHNEMLPHNDCLYRNKDLFRYLVILDLDEIIFPVKHFNWSQLLSRLEMFDEHRSDSFSFQSHYFLDGLTDEEDAMVENIPKYLHMMRHIYKSMKSPMVGRYKSFHNLERLVSGSDSSNVSTNFIRS